MLLTLSVAGPTAGTLSKKSLEASARALIFEGNFAGFDRVGEIDASNFSTRARVCASCPYEAPKATWEMTS